MTSERASELVDHVPEGLLSFGVAFAEAAASTQVQKPASAAEGAEGTDGRPEASAEEEGELFDGLLDKQVHEGPNINNILDKDTRRYQSSKNFQHFSEAMKKSLMVKRKGKPSTKEATAKIDSQL